MFLLLCAQSQSPQLTPSTNKLSINATAVDDGNDDGDDCGYRSLSHSHRLHLMIEYIDRIYFVVCTFSSWWYLYVFHHPRPTQTSSRCAYGSESKWINLHFQESWWHFSRGHQRIFRSKIRATLAFFSSSLLRFVCHRRRIPHRLVYGDRSPFFSLSFFSSLSVCLFRLPFLSHSLSPPQSIFVILWILFFKSGWHRID